MFDKMSSTLYKKLFDKYKKFNLPSWIYLFWMLGIDDGWKKAGDMPALIFDIRFS